MGARNIKTLAELATAMAARKAEQEHERANRPRPEKVSKDPLVNVFAAQHGDYGQGFMPDLDTAGQRIRMVKVFLNRGGTAVDRWIANDGAGIFGQGEQNAIRYCQNLWTRAEGNLAAIDSSADKVDAPLGWAQQEAITELHRLQGRVPRTYWDVYENVCRFDEEAGVAGSRIASNSRSAIDAAKTTVAYTACLIAMWRRL